MNKKLVTIFLSIVLSIPLLTIPSKVYAEPTNEVQIIEENETPNVDEKQTDSSEEPQEENVPPTIMASDATIYVGDVFNAVANVYARDKDGNDISNNIIVKENTVDVKVPGSYIVVYEVTDSNGNYADKTITVTVKEVPQVVNTAPVINAENKKITVGDKFDPWEGVSATDKEDGDITDKITMISYTVDVNTAGTYYITFEVKDSNDTAARKNVTVEVVKKAVENTAPILYVNDITIEVGNKYDPYTMVKAKDKEDGDITSKVVVLYNYVNINKAGKYKVGYAVKDSMGAAASWEITVTVKDNKSSDISKTNESPKLYANDIYIALNVKFNPLEWVAATDKEDGDISNKVMVISNEVNTNVEGNYHVTYEVIDSSGNKASKVIMVNVKNEADLKGENMPPKIYAENITIEKGSYFDPLSNVKALDVEDGNLSDNIVVKENNVDITKKGTYKVTYEVKDSMNGVTEKTITVTVKSNGESLEIVIVSIGVGLVILIGTAIIVFFTATKKKNNNQ